MAGARGWNLDLDVDAVLAAQGADPATVRRRNPGLVEAAERALRDGKSLLAPTAIQRALVVERRGDSELILSGGGRLAGTAPVERLRDAHEVVTVLCTIGPALEARTSATLADDPVYALALDGVGTAAVDALTSAVCAQVATDAEARRWRATPPLSPGMMGWPLAEGQDGIFSLLDARAVGVVLTASHVMIPRKSVSMVIGIGPRIVPGGEPCAWCNMRATCRYRKRPVVGRATYRIASRLEERCDPH